MLMRRKLELIAEEDGQWYRVDDGIEVYPVPVGEPIVDVKLPFEDSYHIIRRHAKQQKLWEDGIGYDVKTSPHWIVDPVASRGCELISGHLYKI